MKIFCVGQNYAEHAKELGNPIPTEPVIFMKPPAAYLANNSDVPYPSFTHDFQYELEIVLKINKTISKISEEEAKTCYSHITAGIDFTARDLQRELWKNELPWEISKSFDKSALVGEMIDKPQDVTSLDFYLLKNGEKVQSGNTNDLIFSFERIISYASQFFTLEENDFIFTGTPIGVGPVQKGDHLEGFLNDKKILDCHIV